MHFFATITAYASMLGALVVAHPTESQPTTISLATTADLGTHDGAPIVPVFWSGQLAVNGPQINITGSSFDQIFEYVNKRIDPAVVLAENTKAAKRSNLQKRIIVTAVCLPS